MKKRLLTSIGLVALIGAGATIAGNRPGAVTLTFGDAYYKFDSARHVDATSMPNVELAYNVTDHFGLEGTFGVLNSNLSADLDTGQLEGDLAHGFLYTIDGLYRFVSYKIIEPYLVAGIGVIGLKPAGNEAVQQGLVNAGIGAQAFFDKSLALRAEFREMFTTTGSGFNDYFVNFGISYLIDT
ncbi:MAG: outer membrane beta-barrel protein [Gammaproteobacteria bacterium]